MRDIRLPERAIARAGPPPGRRYETAKAAAITTGRFAQCLVPPIIPRTGRGGYRRSLG